MTTIEYQKQIERWSTILSNIYYNKDQDHRFVIDNKTIELTYDQRGRSYQFRFRKYSFVPFEQDRIMVVNENFTPRLHIDEGQYPVIKDINAYEKENTMYVIPCSLIVKKNKKPDKLVATVESLFKVHEYEVVEGSIEEVFDFTGTAINVINDIIPKIIEFKEI